MLELISFVVGLFASIDDVERLRGFDAQNLTIESARRHLGAARTVGFLTDNDPELLLGIASHESNFQHDAITQEPGHRVSCGAMTPEPLKTCTPTTLEAGYLAGAVHLNKWRALYPNDIRRALQGYAGGGEMHGLVGKCRQGPVVIRPGVDACKTPDVFLYRAWRIKHGRSRLPRSPGV